jgi:hypothetical protein
VLIAISTYTEPVPVNTAVVEPAQTHEPEENEEPGEFAKLLAGLLQKRETDDVPPADFSGAEADFGALMLEETDAGNLTDLFGITGKIRDSFDEHDFDAEISEEQLGMNAGYLFAGSFGQDVVDADADDYLSEISNLTITDNLPEAKPEPEPEHGFFMLDSTGTALAGAGVSQIAGTDAATQSAAMQNIEESPAGAGGKKDSVSKDRSLSKNEDIEALLNKTGRSDEIASLRSKPENESPGRLDELRSRSRRDRVTFEVRDMRTGETNAVNNAQTRSYTVTETAAGRVHGETPVREITLELRLPDQHNGSTGQSTAQTTWEAKAGGTAIENMLARELHQNFNGDIVRHASMALHDGGEGTIKITLKPESLGNVKIRLEMTENKITGHIVVESKEALNAFRKEIASLEQAFRDSGFTNADLNLSLTADGRNAQDWEQEPGSFTPQMIASRYDDSSRDSAEHDMRVVDVFVGRKSGSINMLA